jgi:hypothetical protein
MPEIMKAITVTTTVQTASLGDQWGVPLVVGDSTAVAKNTLKSFVTLADIGIEHGTSSLIYLAAQSIFNQGIGTVYTIAIQAAVPGSATPTEIDTAMNGIIDAAVAAGHIQGIMLAGYFDTASVTKLQTNADRVGAIWVACNAPGESVSVIVARAATLSASPNGFMVAYKGTVGIYGIAGAVLGTIMALKPWVALEWKSVTCDVNAYFASADIVTLEAGRVNVILQSGTNNILSNGLAINPLANFIDVTRTQYFIQTQIMKSITAGKMNSETVPYTAIGIATVQGWIISSLESIKSAGALASYMVTMPALTAITEVSRAARVLPGIQVVCQLAGNVQTLTLNLDITV